MSGSNNEVSLSPPEPRLEESFLSESGGNTVENLPITDTSYATNSAESIQIEQLRSDDYTENVISADETDFIGDSSNIETDDKDIVSNLDCVHDNGETFYFDACIEDLTGSTTTNQITVDLDDSKEETTDDSFACYQFVPTEVTTSPVEDILYEDDVIAASEQDISVSMNQEMPEITGSVVAEAELTGSNPFGDDEEDTDQGAASSNPFGDDEDQDQDQDQDQADQNQSNIQKMPVKTIQGAEQRVKSEPFNPFDDGDVEEEETDGKEKALNRRKVVTESLAPFTLVSALTKKSKSPRFTPPEVPSRMYEKEYQELTILGFDKVCVGNALQKTGGDVVAAKKILTTRLFDDHILSNDEIYVWKSPVMIRVGKLFDKIFFYRLIILL